MEEYEIRHLKKIRRYLAECTVLLKNNGDFPLGSAGKIALYGSGARHTVKGGTGSGDVNSRFSVNVERGLEKRGFEIVTRAWLDAYDRIRKDAHKAFIRGIRERARKEHTAALVIGMGAVMPEPEYDLPLDCGGRWEETDTAVYVLARISGEGNDRLPVKGDILLTDTEIRDIRALNEKYSRFMLVLNTGGPVDLSPVMDVKNILVLSQLGVETGSALAWILLGLVNPSGRLTTTWASWQDYCQRGEFGNKDETCYGEGVYVGYRYFDTVGARPLFPFGYGLSYTQFERTGVQAELDGTKITVSCGIRNIGERAGKEVVQLYVSAPAGRIDKPYQELKGFAKTRKLKAGEAETVQITCDLRDLASYDAAAQAFVLGKGDYVLRVGSSSAETGAAAVVRLPEDVCVRKVRKALGDPGFADYVPQARDTQIPEGIPVLTADPGAIVTEETVYDAPEPVDPAGEALTDEELAYLSIGGFDPKAGVASIIGSASTKVAGAAGQTTGVLADRGVEPVVMADGPAGLRLNQEYYLDEKGNAKAIGASLPAGFEDLLPPGAGLLMKLMAGRPKKGVQIRTQYCTAIPIGTAIAQTWNPEAALCFGDIVGEEMEQFGVDLWLAPALNIHRSIRCGRNFEYYSEDPLISGKMAAAITNGVQKHPGCGTTIKHFAANNQETNRLASNSRVSERAMREIYLRGFEICVRESQPMAVMTSYNLLNGVHTSERRDLTMDILRAEWGFKGIVMTDWVVPMMIAKGSKHRAANAVQTILAGGDLFMPGGKGDWDSVMKALADGTLTREDLARTGTRVWRMARR